MPLTHDDIDIFILSYNRGEMIGATIQSLLNQTLDGFKITILDNASTDNTAEVVAALNSARLDFCTVPANLGAVKNFKRTQELASKKYLMIFHDDDQLHPEYLETALRWLNQYPNADLLVPNKMNIVAGEKVVVSKKIERSAIKLDRIHFTAALFIQNKLAFPGVIYATHRWKTMDLSAMRTRYGKWMDRPIMIETLSKNHSAIILNGPWIFYGRHRGQDTKNAQPPHAMWLNREAYYLELLGDSWSTFSGRCFRITSSRRIKSGFKRRIAKGPSFEEYLADAFKCGATSHNIWKSRSLFPKFIQKLFNLYAQKYFYRHFSISNNSEL